MYLTELHVAYLQIDKAHFEKPVPLDHPHSLCPGLNCLEGEVHAMTLFLQNIN
jgi:hypothetical protein